MHTPQASLLFIGNHFQTDRSNPNVTQSLMTHLRERGWKILSTSQKQNKAIRLLDMLFTIIRKRKVYQIAEVDIFSGLAFIWGELSVSLLKLINKPVVLTLHGGNLPQFTQHHPGRVKNLLRKAEIVVSPSPYLKASLKEIRPDIIIVPNGVDISLYPFIHRRHSKARLVWVRAFHAIYNPSLAPKILKYLKSNIQGINLIMVGPDKGDESFEETMAVAKKLNVHDRIEFPGSIPKQEVPKWLNKGDIFINTTNVDNTPVSVIEAMACGLCIVSTNVGGIPDLLEDGVDALLVPPDDPEAMAKAVKMILFDSRLAAKLSFNARKKAETFSWEKVIPLWEGLLRKALHQIDG
jgi:glycosyltransferase involved in cell wall biosynthesis